MTRIRGQRHRGAIPEARTKAEAQQAEVKIKTKLFERKFGKTSASRNFTEFVTIRICLGPGLTIAPVVMMNYTQVMEGEVSNSRFPARH